MICLPRRFLHARNDHVARAGPSRGRAVSSSPAPPCPRRRSVLLPESHKVVAFVRFGQGCRFTKVRLHVLWHAHTEHGGLQYPSRVGGGGHRIWNPQRMGFPLIRVD